MAKKKKKKGKA